MTLRGTIVVTLATGLALIFFTGSAPAQVPRAACQTEIAKFCPGMKPGDGHYGQCLVDHQKNFSAPCKKYADAAAARKEDLKQFPACIADAERLCPNTPPSLTRIRKCLRTHQGDLSPDCKQEIGKRTGKYR
jgi:hypothetical protein